MRVCEPESALIGRVLLLAVVLVGAPVSASNDGEGGVEVVDPAGRPIANAKVTWWDRAWESDVERINHSPTALWEWSGVTDERGRAFARELAIGPGRLEVEAPAALGGRCAGLTRRRWSGKAARWPVRVQLRVRAVARSELRGRAVDGGGAGVEGATIRALGTSWASATDTDCHAAPEIEAISGVDGTFVLRSVLQGKTTLVVKHPRYAEREVELMTPALSTDVVLDAGTTWKGRILRPDGSVLEQCEIGLSLQNPPTAREVACSSAGFVLEHLPPGLAELHVSTRRTGDPILGARIWQERMQIPPNEVLDKDLKWPAGETIVGRIVTSDGVPIPGAFISAIPISKTLLGDGSGYGVATASDAEGRFIFRSLTFSGQWMLKAQPHGYRETRLQVKVGTTDVVLTMIDDGPPR
jgi:Carboxypeptidase regulatory-like domain